MSPEESGRFPNKNVKLLGLDLFFTINSIKNSRHSSTTFENITGKSIRIQNALRYSVSTTHINTMSLRKAYK